MRHPGAWGMMSAVAELIVETTEGVTLRRELAGAGSRFAAALVDVIAFSLVALTLVFLIVAGLQGTDVPRFTVQVFVMGGSVLAWLVTLFLAHLILGGRTPGKMLLGLRVVGQDGHPASAMQIALRSVLWIVDSLPLPISVGLLVILGSSREQRLGDMVAGTVVVFEPQKRGISEPWPRERHEDLQLEELGLTPALANRFEGEDLDLLREVVTRAGLGGEGRAELFRRVTDHYLARLGKQEQVAPRVALKELYLFLREQKKR